MSNHENIIFCFTMSDDVTMSNSKSIVDDCLNNFNNLSSDRPRLFFAPGRANLLGAHMDYNGGVVMPVTLSKGTYLAMSPRSDQNICVISAQFDNQCHTFSLGELSVNREKVWASYVEAACWVFNKRWPISQGFNLAITSNLPIAKGLSSSASLVCVVLYALSQYYEVDVTTDELIHLAHQAENEYVGVRCGVLDQTAIFLGKHDSVLVFDCQDLSRQYAPLQGDDVSIAIIDSHKPRKLATSEFNQRVSECTSALSKMQSEIPGLRVLRDLNKKQLEEHGSTLSDTEYRRVSHVVEETLRTKRGLLALQDDDIATFGICMSQSHQSLKNLYEVSIPELDSIVDSAVAVDGCYGSRLTGAGFGGCVVALVHPSIKREFETEVCSQYMSNYGIKTNVDWFQPAGKPLEILLD